MKGANAPLTVNDIQVLQRQLRSEQQLFTHLKKNNGCFEELKEIYIRIKQLEQHIEQLSNSNVHSHA
jgi:hypothetical protein